MLRGPSSDYSSVNNCGAAAAVAPLIPASLTGASVRPRPGLSAVGGPRRLIPSPAGHDIDTRDYPNPTLNCELGGITKGRTPGSVPVLTPLPPPDTRLSSVVGKVRGKFDR